MYKRLLAIMLAKSTPGMLSTRRLMRTGRTASRFGIPRLERTTLSGPSVGRRRPIRLVVSTSTHPAPQLTKSPIVLLEIHQRLQLRVHQPQDGCCCEASEKTQGQGRSCSRYWRTGALGGRNGANDVQAKSPALCGPGCRCCTDRA